MAAIEVTADVAIALAMAAFMAVAIYNVLELTVILFSLFKRRSGLYFWSFFLSTWGIFFHTLGFLTSVFGIIESAIGWMTIAVFGWIPMVTGQSLVLYSRLHLVEENPLVLRMVLGMIITNVFVCHIPIIIIAYSGALAADSAPYDAAYVVYEKVQVTLFFMQEVIISGLYVWNVHKSKHVLGFLHGAEFGKTLRHLTVVNVVVILLDVTVLVLEYKGLYNMQNVIKGAVYSVKLKLEFTVLNNLVNLIKGGTTTPSGNTGAVHSQSHRYAAGSADRGEDISLGEAGKSRISTHQRAGSGNGNKGYQRTSEAAADDKAAINKSNESIDAVVIEVEVLPSCSSQDGFARRAF